MQVWLKDNLLPIPNFVSISGAPKVEKFWYAKGLAHELTTRENNIFSIGNGDNERRLKKLYSEIFSYPAPSCFSHPVYQVKDPCRAVLIHYRFYLRPKKNF